MNNKREFYRQLARPRELRGGIRFKARATQAYVERTVPTESPTEAAIRDIRSPGRGQNGESSN